MTSWNFKNRHGCHYPLCTNTPFTPIFLENFSRMLPLIWNPYFALLEPPGNCHINKIAISSSWVIICAKHPTHTERMMDGRFHGSHHLIQWYSIGVLRVLAKCIARREKQVYKINMNLHKLLKLVLTTEPHNPSVLQSFHVII